MSLKVIAYEEQPVTALGLRTGLREFGEVDLIGLFDRLEDALSASVLHTAHVLLIGQPPGVRSMQPLLRRVMSDSLRSAVIAWATEISDVECVRALQAGARGVITRSHSVKDMVACMMSAGRGEVWIPSSANSQEQTALTYALSARELQVAELVAHGLKNRDIAVRLSITPGTVKVHLSHIFEKTGLRDRFQLALRARDLLSRAS